MSKELTAAQDVQNYADRQIEEFRLMLDPEVEDLTIEIDENGSMTVEIDCIAERTFTAQELNDSYDYNDSTVDDFDLDDIREDLFDELRENASERFYEVGLEFTLVTAEDSYCDMPYFRYLLSWGGPGTEIRFFVSDSGKLLKSEFWYLPWYDGAFVNVTKDSTIQMVWSRFEDHAEHLWRKEVDFDDTCHPAERHY